MTEAAGAPFGFGEGFGEEKIGVQNGQEKHLCDAVAARDGEGFVAVVDESDANFAAIVRIDHADPVGERNAFFDTESAPTRDDGDHALGFGGNGKSRGDQRFSPARSENDRFALVERLAGEIAGICLGFDPRIESVRVTVGKPGAIIGAETVEVELFRRR